MPKEALLKKPSLMPKHIKSTPGQPSITVGTTSETGSAIGGTLALQSTAGNKVTKAAKAELARTEGGSAAIIGWLKGEAAKDKKSDLFAHYEGLAPLSKQLAHFRFSGGGTPSLAKAKKFMTGFFGRSVDWDKFSTIIRDINKENTQNHNADTNRDFTGYGLAGVKGASQGASAGASAVGKAIGGTAENTTKASNSLGPATSMLGGLSSGLQVANALHNDNDSMESYERFDNAVGQGGGGLADMASAGANSAINMHKALGTVAGVAATTAVGAASIVGGAAYMVSGTAGAISHHKRVNKLNELEKNAGKDDALREAASFGAKSQSINRATSGMTALKGAAMIIGGGLLLASATTPVGWILLGVAGAIGGIAAVYKFYKKRVRQNEVVDRFLDVDKKIEKLQAGNPDEKVSRDEVRQKLLQKSGFNSMAQCYNQITADLAQTIFNKGVKGKDQQYVELLSNIGLKVDHKKLTPKPDMIAKKLHN